MVINATNPFSEFLNFKTELNDPSFTNIEYRNMRNRDIQFSFSYKFGKANNKVNFFNKTIKNDDIKVIKNSNE